MLTRINSAAADVLERPAGINLVGQPAEWTNCYGLRVAEAQKHRCTATAVFASAFTSDFPLPVAAFDPVGFFKTAQTCIAHG